jgi:3-deoxy-D-arabino-heptulosonate 7-phosphate (DAHP) synthase
MQISVVFRSPNLIESHQLKSVG